MRFTSPALRVFVIHLICKIHNKISLGICEISPCIYCSFCRFNQTVSILHGCFFYNLRFFHWEVCLAAGLLHTLALNRLHRKIPSCPILPGHSIFPPVGKVSAYSFTNAFSSSEKIFLETLLYAPTSLPALSEKVRKIKVTPVSMSYSTSVKSIG